MTIPDSEVCFLQAENGLTLKTFVIRGRDFLIHRYKFMNALNRYKNL